MMSSTMTVSWYSPETTHKTRSKTGRINPKPTRHTSRMHPTWYPTTKEHVENIVRIDFLSIKMHASITRSAPTTSAIWIFISILIVNASLLRIAQSCVCKPKSLERLVRIWGRVFIGMTFQGEFTVGLFQICVSGIFLNRKNRIVCSFTTFLRCENLFDYI